MFFLLCLFFLSSSLIAQQLSAPLAEGLRQSVRLEGDKHPLFGLQTEQGQELLPAKYYKIAYQHGLVRAQKMDLAMEYYLYQDEKLIPLPYSSAWIASAEPGILTVGTGGKYGLIDKSGQGILFLNYQSSSYYRESGHYIFCKNSEAGGQSCQLFDAEGKEIKLPKNNVSSLMLLDTSVYLLKYQDAQKQQSYLLYNTETAASSIEFPNSWQKQGSRKSLAIEKEGKCFILQLEDFALGPEIPKPSFLLDAPENGETVYAHVDTEQNKTSFYDAQGKLIKSIDAEAAPLGTYTGTGGASPYYMSEGFLRHLSVELPEFQVASSRLRPTIRKRSSEARGRSYFPLTNAQELYALWDSEGQELLAPEYKEFLFLSKTTESKDEPLYIFVPAEKDKKALLVYEEASKLKQEALRSYKREHSVFVYSKEEGKAEARDHFGKHYPVREYSEIQKVYHTEHILMVYAKKVGAETWAWHIW